MKIYNMDGWVAVGQAFVVLQRLRAPTQPTNQLQLRPNTQKLATELASHSLQHHHSAAAVVVVTVIVVPSAWVTVVAVVLPRAASTSSGGMKSEWVGVGIASSTSV